MRVLPRLLALACLVAGAASAHPHPPDEAGPGPQGRLGIQLQPMTPELRAFLRAPEDRGVLVVRVNKDSAAEKAGLQVGDVIVGIGGAPVREPRELVEPVMRAGENAEVELEVVRSGKTRELRAALSGKPFEHFSSEEPFHWFQRGLQQLGPELEKRLEELERRIDELERQLEDRLSAKPERST